MSEGIFLHHCLSFREVNKNYLILIKFLYYIPVLTAILHVY